MASPYSFRRFPSGSNEFQPEGLIQVNSPARPKRQAPEKRC